MGVGVFKNKTEYEKALPNSPKAPIDGLYFKRGLEIPILFNIVKTIMGTCFSIHTEELATLEQKYQG